MSLICNCSGLKWAQKVFTSKRWEGRVSGSCWINPEILLENMEAVVTA
jgi:hypothetical protein